MKLAPDTVPPTGGSSAGPFRSPARPAPTPPEPAPVVHRETMRQVHSVKCPSCGRRIRIKTTTVTTTRKKVAGGFGIDDVRKALEVAGAAAPVVRDALKALGVGS